jgi:hypothetical protein
MYSPWLREPLRYFVFYAASSVVILPCAIAFAYLKAHGHGSVLPLPIIVGTLAGLVCIGWLENRGKDLLPSSNPISTSSVFGTNVDTASSGLLLGGATRVRGCPTTETAVRAPWQLASSIVIESHSQAGLNSPRVSTTYVPLLLTC